MTWLALAWRFRKPLAIAAALVAAIALFGAALAWHAHRVKAFGAERYVAGASAEREKWRAELGRLKAEQEKRRRSDEEKLRNIAVTLADEKARRRDQEDTFERRLMELEADDAKTHGAPNPFDPRVLQLVR